MLKRTRHRSTLVKASVPLTAIMLLASGCGGNDSTSAQSVVDAYAEGVHASYAKSLESAKAVDKAVDAFVANPTQTTLDEAKSKWLAARDDYGLTEAFRFYAGPIDNEENGEEGQINSWPLDENYIDYVEGQPRAGIINTPEFYPTISEESISEANGVSGEANVSTGWHAIEFLLWGQDLSETGPGNRPVTDYTTAANADRRKAYLAATSDLLIKDLDEVTVAWAPDADNYRKSFVEEDTNESLRKMITGIGELSRGELVGERMNTAFLDRSQEDEHSCFSDNTHNDIIANAEGIRRVALGEYAGAAGASFADLVAEKDKALADRLRKEVDASVAATKAIPAPFDAALREGVPDDDPSRVAVQAAMDALNTQTDTIVEAAKKIGVSIEVS